MLILDESQSRELVDWADQLTAVRAGTLSPGAAQRGTSVHRMPFLTCPVCLNGIRCAAYRNSVAEIHEVMDTGDPGFWGEFLTQQRIKHFQA